MLSEDYIIRMIQLAVAALLKISGLRKSGLYEDAQVAIDLGLEQLLGLRASRVKNLEDERLYLLSSDSRLDTRRLALVSALFEAEGDVLSDQNRMADSQASYARALRYALEVFFQERDQAHQDQKSEVQEAVVTEPEEAGQGGIEQKIAALLQKIQPEPLSSDTLWPLAGYYEEAGQYAQAETALLMLASRPGLRAELLPELAEFYQRLLLKPEDQLTAGGLSPAKIRENLNRL